MSGKAFLLKQTISHEFPAFRCLIRIISHGRDLFGAAFRGRSLAAWLLLLQSGKGTPVLALAGAGTRHCSPKFSGSSALTSLNSLQFNFRM